nr:hypothetical protein [uncultured bacterium]
MRSDILPTRPYQLFFEHRPDYLYAYVQSLENSFEIARGYWIEILSMLHRRRYRRVLIEKNVAQRLAAHDVFELVSELAHSGQHEVAFAIWDRNYDPDLSNFEETVGTNRGLNLRIGRDAAELERWLLSQSRMLVPDHSHFPFAHATAA